MRWTHKTHAPTTHTTPSLKSPKCTEAQALHTAHSVKWNYLECLDSIYHLQHKKRYLRLDLIQVSPSDVFIVLYSLKRENISVGPLVTLFVIVFFLVWCGAQGSACKMSLQPCWILIGLCFIVLTVRHPDMLVPTELIYLTWIRSRWHVVLKLNLYFK